MSRASFAKRDREHAKRDKAEAKRQRRQQQTATPDDTPAEAPTDDATTAELLVMIERVHELHREGQMSDDEFQTTKAELLGRLTID